jgi:hypothetical protein
MSENNTRRGGGSPRWSSEEKLALVTALQECEGDAQKLLGHFKDLNQSGVDRTISAVCFQLQHMAEKNELIVAEEVYKSLKRIATVEETQPRQAQRKKDEEHLWMPASEIIKQHPCSRGGVEFASKRMKDPIRRRTNKDTDMFEYFLPECQAKIRPNNRRMDAEQVEEAETPPPPSPKPTVKKFTVEVVGTPKAPASASASVPPLPAPANGVHTDVDKLLDWVSNGVKAGAFKAEMGLEVLKTLLKK